MGYLFRKSHVTIGEPVYFKDFMGLSWLQIELGYIGEFTVEGTEESEQLFGTRKFEGILGGEGDDLLNAGSGNDMIYGGEGNDTIISAAGDGSDSMDGGAGYDNVRYDDSAVPITFDFLERQITRNDDIDHIFDIERIFASTSKTDLVSAAGANRAVTINLAQGVARTSSFSFDISRFEYITGGNDNDTLIGNNGANLIRGNNGNDLLDGNSGNDTLIGGLGDDTLKGGSGSDVLNGSFGDNDMADYSEHDAITLNTALGTVNDGSAIDTLVNIDIVRASGGSNDVVSAEGQSSGVTINLNAGTMSGVTSGIGKIQDFEHIIGGDGNDRLTGDAENNSITGGVGNDTITAQGGLDTIILGVGSGNDSIDGGSGQDTADFQSNVAITFNVQSSSATDGTSTHTFDNVEILLVDPDFENLINASTSTSAVTVNLASQTLTGPGDVATIVGFWHIIGSNSSDTLTGDAKNNELTGGNGDDSLFGGAGDDTFIYLEDSGNDVISDTTTGDSDILDFSSAYAQGDVSAWHAIDSDDDDNFDALEIELSDGNTITVLSYFDDSTDDLGSVAAGDGVLSAIKFSGDISLAFADVAALLT